MHGEGEVCLLVSNCLQMQPEIGREKMAEKLRKKRTLCRVSYRPDPLTVRKPSQQGLDPPCGLPSNQNSTTGKQIPIWRQASDR